MVYIIHIPVLTTINYHYPLLTIIISCQLTIGGSSVAAVSWGRIPDFDAEKLAIVK
jgi:hypothetical protein